MFSRGALPLGQLDFDGVPVISGPTHTGVLGSEGTSAMDSWTIHYGNFRMRHPRFIRYSHVLWFNNGEIATWRREEACTGTEMHPWIANASLPSYFADRPQYLLQGELTLQPNADAALQRLRAMLASPQREVPLYELEYIAGQLRPEGDIPPHGGWFHFCNHLEGSGEVSLLHDVKVSAVDAEGNANHDCGQSGDVRNLLVNARQLEIRRNHLAQSGFPEAQPGAGPNSVKPGERVFWGVITASALYQHWVQNSLPKMAAATLVLPDLAPPPNWAGKDADVAAWVACASSLEPCDPRLRPQEHDELAPQVLDTPVRALQTLVDRFPIIPALYRQSGWLPPVDPIDNVVRASELVYSCRQPPLHPVLWQRGQQALLRAPAPKPLAQRRKIVYCGRSRTGVVENEARRVINEEALLSMLGRWGSKAQRTYVAPAGTPSADDTQFLGPLQFTAENMSMDVDAIKRYMENAARVMELHEALEVPQTFAHSLYTLAHSHPSKEALTAAFNATGEQQRVDEMRRRLARTPDHELYQAEASDDGWAGYDIVEFDHRKYPTVESLLEFWSDARALIGPHGGCLTNVVFMPANSLVVELYPLVGGTRSASPHMAMMMYMQSMFLEHEYWMLPQTTWSRKGHFKVDTALLCEILGVSLGMPPGHDSLDACAGEFSAVRPGILKMFGAH